MAKIEWKTVEEIEAEKNAPKPPTPQEELESLKLQLQLTQEALDAIIMGGM